MLHKGFTSWISAHVSLVSVSSLSMSLIEIFSDSKLSKEPTSLRASLSSYVVVSVPTIPSKSVDASPPDPSNVYAGAGPIVSHSIDAP